MRKRLRNHFIPHEGNNYKPHFVSERNLIGVGLLVLAIFGLTFSVKNLVTKNPDILSAVITSVLVDITNTNRLSEKLSPLELSPVLASAAQLKANDMASKSYFAHTSPDGKSPWYWFKEGGYSFVYAGENLAVNFVDSEDVVRAWMNSEGHRANIMNNKFTEIGIAMAPGFYNGRETIFVVQLFGSPAPQNQPRVVSIAKEEATSTLELADNVEISGAVALAQTDTALSDNLEVLSESKMFIAVENKDYSESQVAEPTDVGEVAQASVVEKIIASPKMDLKAIYVCIGLVVLLSLVLFVWIKPKGMHKKNVFYVIALLVVIIVLFYFSSALLFPQILVE